MKISIEQTKYYKYKIEFEDSPFEEALSFMHYLQSQFTWQEISYADKSWHFTKPILIDIIKSKYPEVVIDPNVHLDAEEIELNNKKTELTNKKVEEIKTATTSNLKIKGIKGTLYDFQKLAVEAIQISNGKMILASEMGVGKELFYKTLIATPSGWKKIKNLKIDDYVIGKNGKKTKVLGIYPQGRKRLYRFTLTDGSSCLCGLEHLWNIKYKDDPYSNKEWRTITTKELLKKRITNSRGNAQYMIPFAKPIQFKKRKFFIHPYTLGALIGDGALTCSSISISIPDNKEHILTKIKKEHPEYAYPIRMCSCPTASFTNGRTSCNEMKRNIKKLGLNIKSPFRFVPEEYKIGSVQQRLDMLRGLMDTDGSAKKNRITFHTMSLKLAEDVVEIVRSLSGESNVRSYDRTKEDKGIEYQVNVKLDIFCPFSKESYKSKSWWPSTIRGKYGRHIKSIEYEKIDQAICIAVDAIDNLYVIENSIVTHNTVQSLAYITTNNLKKILVITPASLKWNWHEEINKFTKLKATVINSKSGLSIELYNDHNIIIINYDILKKFYQELSSLRFDVCICDEAHYLKGRSQRFKFTKTIAKSISKLLLLTGTPLLNRPVDLFNLLNLIDPFTWSNWFSYTQKYCNGFRDKWGYNANGCSNIEELREKISKYFFRQTKKEVLKELPDKTFIDIPIDLPAKIQSEYDMILESFSDYLKDIKNKTDSEIKKTMQAEKLVRLNELRQKASEGKIKSAEEIINNVLDNGEKIVVFSAYNLPLITLKESFLDKSVIIIGNTPELERKKAVNEFQNNDKIKIFFGGMLSASVGLTLTAANNVLFLDYPWRPSDRSQAYSRIERIGQTKRMNIMQLIARNTIDQQMRTLLNKKQELFDKLIENENVVNEKMSNESLANSLIKNIETS